MRLICPNCGAQYEVDDSVVPENGRDVQCSNCGHTWYQRPASKDRELKEEIAAQDAVVTDDTVPESGEADDQIEEIPETPDEAPAAEERHEHATEHAEQPEGVADEPASDEAARDTDKADAGSDAAQAQEHPGDDHPEADEHDTASVDGEEQEEGASEEVKAAPAARALDDGVASILREEAAREAAERSGQAAGGLGLQDGPEEVAPNMQERMARLRGSDDELGATAAAAAAAVGSGQRKDLLPDIEEINSTLTASSEAAEAETEEVLDQKRRSGFRLGFGIAAMVFAAMALVYVFAPNIVEAFPQTGAAMLAYVDWINGLRTSVDGMLQTAVAKLTLLLDQINAGEAG